MESCACLCTAQSVVFQRPSVYSSVPRKCFCQLFCPFRVPGQSPLFCLLVGSLDRFWFWHKFKALAPKCFHSDTHILAHINNGPQMAHQERSNRCTTEWDLHRAYYVDTRPGFVLPTSSTQRERESTDSPQFCPIRNSSPAVVLSCPTVTQTEAPNQILHSIQIALHFDQIFAFVPMLALFKVQSAPRAPELLSSNWAELLFKIDPNSLPPVCASRSLSLFE